MAENNVFSEAIKDLESMRDAINKAAEQSEDVKAGNCTAEEEKMEPSYLLYNQIAKSSIDMLKQPEISKVFDNIKDIMGEEIAKGLIEVFAISMTHSAHNAVLFYDDLLKIELTKQFENLGDHINTAKSDISAHGAVIEILRKDLNDIKSKLLIDQFNKDNKQ